MTAEKVIDSLANRMLDLERLVDIGYNETNDLMEQQKNENTRKVTECHMRVFTSMFQHKNDNRLPENIPPGELDKYIAQFLISVHKKGDSDLNDGERQFESQTLMAMHSSIHRYLGSKNYGVNIKQDELFRHSRDVLAAKMKELKTIGKGNLPSASRPFTDNELRIFIEKDLLGTSK